MVSNYGKIKEITYNKILKELDIFDCSLRLITDCDVSYYCLTKKTNQVIIKVLPINTTNYMELSKKIMKTIKQAYKKLLKLEKENKTYMICCMSVLK